MKNGIESAAICGLFCGSCGAYPNECEGCLSERVAADCASCGNGFRDCTNEHRVTRCYECGEFPCGRLKDFSTKHWVNGICHHANVINDLRYMSEHSVEDWVLKQTDEHTCKHCGRAMLWYESECSGCKQR